LQSHRRTQAELRSMPCAPAMNPAAQSEHREEKAWCKPGCVERPPALWLAVPVGNGKRPPDSTRSPQAQLRRWGGPLALAAFFAAFRQPSSPPSSGSLFGRRLLPEAAFLAGAFFLAAFFLAGAFFLAAGLLAADFFAGAFFLAGAFFFAAAFLAGAFFFAVAISISLIKLQ
jgi:hypothetical protein